MSMQAHEQPLLYVTHSHTSLMTPTATQPALEAIGVHKQYPNGVRALNNINLTVTSGETLVLIGETGSGKSTLLRMFNRLDAPTSGQIRIQGQTSSDENPVELRRRIGYVPQEGGLLPHWTVERNIALVPTLLHWDRDRIQSRIASLLELVNLDPKEHRTRYPIQLSGGQRQRVAFARALAADPTVVLLDEPFGALDALTRDDLQQQFLHLKQQLGKTMMLVTHDLHEAFLLGDRVAVMKDGDIVQIGTPDDVQHRPTHDYVRALLRHGSRRTC
ncbi:MAG: ATP-binding cassette domain-containing protein [Nitrospirota bacterium]|nr:ATP-binding cassette domain-containing protein [Nitrospirota bacterium]